MSNTTKHAEEALELSKMFHEIKNPLTLISSSLQFIEAEHPEVKDFRFWNQTMKDTQNLCTLVNDLSAFQKSSTLHPALINLFDFVEDLLESIESFLLEKGTPLTLENTIDDLDFYADKVKLRQAIINLLKNAAESSQNGSSILLRLTADQNFLHISVADHGCGMSEEALSRIFEPFHTTKPYGTGLGLPIVKKIVESHHGTISIKSAEGAGTVFTLNLPLP